MIAPEKEVKSLRELQEYEEKMKAKDTQVGGNHYLQLNIQPIEYIHENGLGYFEGNVIKYITRHKYKNGAEDVRKAKQYCDFLLTFVYGEDV